MMRHYFIPDYVHFACEGDAAVFMNLRSDQYSMFLGAKACAFRSLLSRTKDSYDRVIALDDSEHVEDAELRRHVTHELLQNRLLIPYDGEVGAPIPLCIPLPERALLEPQDAERPTIALRDVWQFIVSCLVARLRLTCASIEVTVRAVEHRNRNGRSRSPFNPDEARRLLRIYNRLRPLIPKDFLCLYDSLSILEFLARYDCFPSWIFAVQLEPWTAHCWVQYETVAFNQDVDEARSYLPLVAV